MDLAKNLEPMLGSTLVSLSFSIALSGKAATRDAVMSC